MSQRKTKRGKPRASSSLARSPRRPGESRLSHWLRVRVRTAVLRFGKGIRPGVNEILGRSSKIGAPPFFDPGILPWVKPLESRWEEIRKEAEFVLGARAQLPPLYLLSPDHGRIAEDDKWKVFFLKGYGFWIEEGCRRCPATYAAVKEIPGLESAFFSILEAGKHIRRHRGPTRAIFTAHLGLLIPRARERCWIEVARIRRHWEPGRALVFDDTYRHEVRNDTDEDRVVLLLHVRRPLRFPGSLLGSLVFNAIKWSPFVQDGRRNQRAWNERHARDEGRD